MPNLLVYIKRGIARKLQLNFLNLKEMPDFLVVSAGGCGSVSLIKYLENFGKSNLYFERNVVKLLRIRTTWRWSQTALLFQIIVFGKSI